MPLGCATDALSTFVSPEIIVRVSISGPFLSRRTALSRIDGEEHTYAVENIINAFLDRVGVALNV
jgi:hypothetical protein